MSASGIRAAQSNRDEARLRATGGQQVNAEELLAELVRLVESSALASERSEPPAQPAPEHDRTDAGPKHPLEETSGCLSVDAALGKPSETGAVDVEPPRAPGSGDSYSGAPYGIDLATGRRSGTWLFRLSALVLAGAAAIGSFYWFKPDEPGSPKAPPFIAASRNPTVQPRTDSTVATSSDAGAAPAGDLPQPAPVKMVNSEERPTDLSSRASLNDAPPPVGLVSTATDAAQPAVVESAGKPLAAPVNTPAPAAQNAASPPLASQTLDSKPAPTVSLPTDSPQIATPTRFATESGQAAQASDAPLPPVRPTSKAVGEAAGDAQRSTPKLELPTKLSSKSAHVVVAKAEASPPGASVEKPRRAPRRAASVKPEKEVTTVTPAQNPAEAQAAPPPAPPAPAQQPNPNAVVHAFNNMVGMVGALTSFIPFGNH